MKFELIAAAFALALLVFMPSHPATGDEQADLYQKSVDFEVDKKYQESLDELEKISGALKSSYAFQLRKGWLLYLLGKYEKAITSYKAAVAKEPRSVEALLGLMPPQMAVRKWVDAEKTGKRILKLDPGTGKTLAELETPGAGVVASRQDAPDAIRTGAHGLEWVDGKLWVATPPPLRLSRL